MCAKTLWNEKLDNGTEPILTKKIEPCVAALLFPQSIHKAGVVNGYPFKKPFFNWMQPNFLCWSLLLATINWPFLHFRSWIIIYFTWLIIVKPRKKQRTSSLQETSWNFTELHGILWDFESMVFFVSNWISWKKKHVFFSQTSGFSGSKEPNAFLEISWRKSILFKMNKSTYTYILTGAASPEYLNIVSLKVNLYCSFACFGWFVNFVWLMHNNFVGSKGQQNNLV